MNNIPSLNFLFKRLGIFTVVFIGLTLLSSLDTVRRGHNSFYCGITNVIFNSINPEILAEFSTESRTDVKHYGIAIKLYPRDKYTKQQLSKANRRFAQPQTTKFPNQVVVGRLNSTRGHGIRCGGFGMDFSQKATGFVARPD